MPEASLSLTERAVERFTEQYLGSIDADVIEKGDKWLVSAPADADDELGLREATLSFDADGDADAAEDATPVGPESGFLQELLEHTKDRQPIGAVPFTVTNTEVKLPDWLTESRASVTDAEFDAANERTAACVLFDVEIETVSEYQTELLEAVAVDLDTAEAMPALAETYLDVTDVDQDSLQKATVSLGMDRVKSALDAASTEVETQLQPIIDETRESASRIADVEMDEFRQLKQQRLDELRGDIRSFDQRLDDVRETIEETDDEAEREKLAGKRDRLEAERAELAAERDALVKKRAADYPEKRREVYDRHALTVQITPVAMTFITYETGELRLTFQNETNSQATTFQTAAFEYATGVGVTETATCDRCGDELNADNPGLPLGGQLRGEQCCR